MPDVENTPKHLTPGLSKIVEYLRHERLGCSDSAAVKVASAKSLHVQIHKLRSLGYKIVSDRQSAKEAPGRPGQYVLISEPVE